MEVANICKIVTFITIALYEYNIFHISIVVPVKNCSISLRCVNVVQFYKYPNAIFYEMDKIHIHYIHILYMNLIENIPSMCYCNRVYFLWQAKCKSWVLCFNVCGTNWELNLTKQVNTLQFHSTTYWLSSLLYLDHQPLLPYNEILATLNFKVMLDRWLTWLAHKNH